MATIIDGKKLAQEIRAKLKIECEELKQKGIVPKLAVIMVGDDKASQVYVRNKSKACNEIGIEFEEYLLNENIKQKELIELIEKLNKDTSIKGILLQSPIPKGLDINEAFRTIAPEKDVDGFHPLTLGKLFIGEHETFVPCTPKGIMTILDDIKTEYEGKHAVIVGRSRIVGKPISQILLKRGATVTICHSKTKDIANYTRQADILVVAVGRPHIITQDMVKEGAIVVDVGINRINGKIIGDVDTENVLPVCSKITPVPGGVGITTVLSLLQNVVQAAREQNDVKKP